MDDWPYADVSATSETYLSPTASDYASYSLDHDQGQLLSPGYSSYSSYAASTSSQHSGYSRERAETSPYPPSRPSHSRSPSYHSSHRNSTSPYPASASHSPSFAYTTSPYDSPSPLSFHDPGPSLDPDIIDPDIIDCFFPLGTEVSASQPSPSATGASATSFLCDYPSCNKTYPRLCDLRKHKKRHAKPFPCPVASCDAFFSTEKDRDRHEKSKHRREEHLVCPSCGHRTARKDNLKDHVRRRHGEAEVERIMRAVSAGGSAE
jgi:hypothetical protein